MEVATAIVSASWALVRSPQKKCHAYDHVDNDDDHGLDHVDDDDNDWIKVEKPTSLKSVSSKRRSGQITLRAMIIDHLL